MEVRFKIEGARELENVMRQLGPAVANRVGIRALVAGARPIVERAKSLVPVRTGALRDAIAAQAQRQRSQSERTVQIGVERPTSRRAHLVEFGTVHSAAQPFLRPALDEAQGSALGEMARVLGDGVAREAERLASAKG